MGDSMTDQDDEYGYTHDDSGEWRVWRPAQEVGTSRP
jgi:hypothetical protein